MGIHVLVVALMSVSASAKPIAYVICKLKGNVRTVRNEVDDKGVCNTIYSKAGEEKTVGSAKSRESCTKVFNNVKDNLLKSSWKCRDVESATFSESDK